MATTADDWTWVKAFTAITTGGDIPIDIMTQSLGSLDVDIIASTIGNIPININQQGLGDITIDLNAQTIDRVIIRDNDGGIESSSNAIGDIDTETTKTYHTYSGSGSFRYCFFRVDVHADAHFAKPIVTIDGTDIMPKWTFLMMSGHGLDKNTRPLQLLLYGADAQCGACYYFEKGLVFDTSIAFKIENTSATETLTGQCNWFYQKLT